MVSPPESGFRPLHASSRDDHELLCGNRRVIGMLERVRCRWRRQDRAREQGCERAGGLDRLVSQARIELDADRSRGRAAVAMALCGGAPATAKVGVAVELLETRHVCREQEQSPASTWTCS